MNSFFIGGQFNCTTKNLGDSDRRDRPEFARWADQRMGEGHTNQQMGLQDQILDCILSLLALLFMMNILSKAVIEGDNPHSLHCLVLPPLV
jgi:hypothetical protein